jgi:hypothetical protein
MAQQQSALGQMQYIFLYLFTRVSATLEQLSRAIDGMTQKLLLQKTMRHHHILASGIPLLLGRVYMNRRKLILATPLFATALILAGCSGAEESALEKPERMEAAEAPAEMASADAAAGPNVRVSAAPGVAFNYRYAFRVPDAKIAGVQEEHAAACETLGLSRCRITGMRYQLIDEDEVNASLAFKLDPSIARKFGKDAISSVEKAKGILVDSEISGIDVGSQITASQRRSSDLQAELNRIEARLKAGGMGDRERTELQEQAQRMRDQLDGERDTRRVGEESLATTPMEFSYSGGEGIPGFGSGNPFAGAWETAIASFVTMASFLLLLIGGGLPWVLLVVGLIWLLRSKLGLGVRRWWGSNTPLNDKPVKD